MTISRRCALPCIPKTAHFTLSNYRVQDDIFDALDYD